MALIAAHLNAGHSGGECSDRYILSLFPRLHTPPPFSPSLISLMVSVDVKHHVYLFSVSRLGPAVRLVSRRTSARYRFGSPFSSKGLWFIETNGRKKTGQETIQQKIWNPSLSYTRKCRHAPRHWFSNSLCVLIDKCQMH